MPNSAATGPGKWPTSGASCDSGIPCHVLHGQASPPAKGAPPRGQHTPTPEVLPRQVVRHQRSEQRRGGIEHRHQPGREVLRGIGQQQERRGGERDAQHQQGPGVRAHRRPATAPKQPGQQHEGGQRQPQGHQGRRAERRHGRAHEQVGRAPEQAQQQQFDHIPGAHPAELSPCTHTRPGARARLHSAEAAMPTLIGIDCAGAPLAQEPP